MRGLSHQLGRNPEEWRVEAEWLANKPDKTPAEVLRLLALRLDADGTKADAKLMIVYEEAGMFRRVLCRGLTGANITALLPED